MNPGYGEDFGFPSVNHGFSNTTSDNSNSEQGGNSVGEDILQNFPYLRQSFGQGLYSQPLSTASTQEQNFDVFKAPYQDTCNYVQFPENTSAAQQFQPSLALQSHTTQDQLSVATSYVTNISEIQNQIGHTFKTNSIHTANPTVSIEQQNLPDLTCPPFPASVSLPPSHGGLMSPNIHSSNYMGMTVNSSYGAPIAAVLKKEDNIKQTFQKDIATVSSEMLGLSDQNLTSLNQSISQSQQVDSQSLIEFPPDFSTNVSEPVTNVSTVLNIPKPVEWKHTETVDNTKLVIKNELNENQTKLTYGKADAANDESIEINDKVKKTENFHVKYFLKGHLHFGLGKVPKQTLLELVDSEEVFFDNVVMNIPSRETKSADLEVSVTSIVPRSRKSETAGGKKVHYTEPSIADIRAGVMATTRDVSNQTKEDDNDDDSNGKTDEYDADGSFADESINVASKDCSLSQNWYSAAMKRYADISKDEDFETVSPSIKKGGRSDPDNPFALTSPSFSESAAKALMTTTNSSTATIVMISIMSIGSREKLIPNIVNSKAAEGGIVSVVNPIESKDSSKASNKQTKENAADTKVEVKSEMTPIMSKLKREKKEDTTDIDETDTEIDRLDINIKIDDDQYVCHGDHKRWQCKLCPKSYTTKHNLVAHILDHSGIKPHLCLVCGKYFKQLSHLNTHMLTHDNVKPHICPICNKGFTQISHLKRHETVHLASKPYICDICNKGFAYPSELRIHKDKHIPGKEKCLECDQEFNTQKELRDHMLLDKHCHDLTCKHCERVFKFPSQLRDHMMSHAGSRPFICSECGMDFMKEHHLKAHQFTHTGLRPYSCPHCNRAFNQKANMMRHMLIHNADRAFKCEVCAKTFTQPQTLKAHMVVHADKKPYSCKYCGKQFGRQHNLQGHLHIHSDSKPYICSICQSSFTLKGNLNRHKKVKHGLNESTENMEEDAVNFLSSLSGRANDSLVDTDPDFDSRDEMTSPDTRSPKKGRKSVPRKRVAREVFGSKSSFVGNDGDISSDGENSNMISYSDEERENEARMKGVRSKYFDSSDSERSRSRRKRNVCVKVENEDESLEDTYYDNVDDEEENGLEDEVDEDYIEKDENGNGVGRQTRGRKEGLEQEKRPTRGKRKRKESKIGKYMEEEDGEEDELEEQPNKLPKKGAKLDNIIATKFKKNL